MASPVKIKFIQKFLILYFLVLTIVFSSFLTGFYFYYSYLTQTIIKTSQNALFIGDFHSLKETIVPLVDDNIKSVEIRNEVFKNVFQHQSEKTGFFDWQFTKKYPSTHHQLVLVYNTKLLLISLSILMALSLLLVFPIYYYEKSKLEKQRKDGLLKLTQQFAHDIRSPLSSLNLLAAKVSDPDLKQLQKSVSENIMLSADQFLAKMKRLAQNQAIDEGVNVSMTISELIQLLEREFELKLASRKLIFSVDSKISSLQHAEIIKPILSNLIQNAIEATDSIKGQVTVQINSNGISVSDNGQDFNLQQLKHMGKRLFTTKINQEYSGNGIALYNAQQELKKMGMHLDIQRTPKSITIVF